MKDKSNMSDARETLNTLRKLLDEGLAISKQGSLDRRLPDDIALRKLREALAKLRAYVPAHSTADGWRALSLAEESLLHYPAAVAALEQAIALSSPPDRKDLKRLPMLREYAAKWLSIGLSPQSLADLGAFLEAALIAHPCDHSYRHTQTWLESVHSSSASKVLSAFQSAGGFCDCEVLLNVV